MDIYPIHNDDDHARAMAEIEELWGAPEGTSDAERLDVLVTLVNAYESEHHRIDAPDPIRSYVEFHIRPAGATPGSWAQ